MNTTNALRTGDPNTCITTPTWLTVAILKNKQIAMSSQWNLTDRYGI